MFDAPNKVGLHLFGDNCCVIENFNIEAVDVTLTLPEVSGIHKLLVLAGEARAELVRNGKSIRTPGLSPRTLIVFTYR